jgi:hypothetical protein
MNRSMDERRFVKVGEIRISPLQVNLIAIILSVPVVILFGLVEYLCHGSPSPEVVDLVYLVVAFLTLIGVHESLHAVGYTTFGGLSWQHLKFGVNWKAFAPYCNCLSPVALSSFRLAALLPTLVLFPVSIAVWLLFGRWWLAFLSACTLLSGIGDVIVFIKTLGHPREVFIIEHPSGIGGDLYALDDKHQGVSA